MIGDIHLMGGEAYIENNTSGTLQKCAPMKWYWQIVLYVITQYKKMGYDETMYFIARHKK